MMARSLFSSSMRCVPFFASVIPAIIISACSSSSPRFTHKQPDVVSADSVKPQIPNTISTAEDYEPAVSSNTGGPIHSYPEMYLAESNPSINRPAMLMVIMSKMGIPYDFNGMDDNGMDCSGFISVVFDEAIGKKLPRSSDDQFNVGKKIDEDKLQFGDLLFFNTTGRIPSHVGIYVGDGLFAHASVSLGVTVSFLNQEYYRQRYVGARRVIQ